MCEREYVACGGCDLPASEYIERRQQYHRTEVEVCRVDDSGEPDLDTSEWADDCESEPGDWEFHCTDCGWTGTTLDQNCVDSECDCEECVEPDIDDTDTYNEDRIVLLVRTDEVHLSTLDCVSPPPEVKRLFTDRTIIRVPMPAWRAVEINEECDIPIRIDFDDPRDWERELMPTYNREES